MATAAVCPVVGSTQDVLPPSHPDVDFSVDGQTCPVVGAKTEHHKNLHKHPKVPGATSSNAEECPALQKIVSQEKEKSMDDEICPVIGVATSVLPPDHPSISNVSDDATCPVVKAKVGDHKSKVQSHPSVANAPTGAVCPVAGVSK